MKMLKVGIEYINKDKQGWDFVLLPHKLIALLHKPRMKETRCVYYASEFVIYSCSANNSLNCLHYIRPSSGSKNKNSFKFSPHHIFIIKHKI